MDTRVTQSGPHDQPGAMVERVTTDAEIRDISGYVRAELERVAAELGHPGVTFEIWRPNG